MIDHEGIWSPKSGKLQWESMISFYILEIKKSGLVTNRQMVVTLKDWKEKKIGISNLTIEEEQITDVLFDCSRLYAVPFLDKVVDSFI